MTDHRRDEAADGLLPHDWAELAPLVDLVLEAAPAHRASVLAELGSGDPERRAALERLVAECERDMPLLNRPAAERFDQLLGEDEAPALPEIVGDRYRTSHEVGRGGMARVYLARDIKHGRDVAIKVVRAELAASLGRDRFLREIAIAARLRHPNILPLYDSGDANGALYFVMPFEAGPSLRERLTKEGPLPVAEALSVLRDVARALQYAHAQGVVHRDIKPDNVLMSGGAAVVTDFGIAKAITLAQTEASPGTMTQAGAGIGTPAYMAPEQAVGDPSTDHRADIYSYGCLAYELFSGHPPFHDLPTHQLIAAHVGTVPRPLLELRGEVPDSVARLVNRCLEKNPDARPQAASELMETLEHPGAVPARSRQHRLSGRAAALTAIVVALIVLGALWRQRVSGSAASPITIAVLPNVNIASDTSLDVFVDGLSDEVATALARVPGIQIQSRSGARLYRGQLGVDAKEAGRKLSADFVVTGTMRAIDGRWKISTELTRTSDAAEVWSESFDRAPAQQVGIAEDIATAIAAALRQRFPGSLGVASSLANNQRTMNLEAYRLYVRGRDRLRLRGLSVKESAESFRRAIQEDSLYAPAYSGLSMALALFPHFQSVPPSAVSDEVERFARRALALDPTQAQPHIALGLMHQFAFRWPAAEAEYQTAIQRDGRDVEARVQYARHLLLRGRTPEAMQQLRVAKQLDPASALVLSWLSYGYYLSGRLDSALVESRRALENDSTNFTTNAFGALVRLALGRNEEALALVRRTPSINGLSTFVIARSGDTAWARRALSTLDNESPRRTLFQTEKAFAYLGLRETEKALDAFEAATDSGEIWPIFEPVTDRIFDDLRASPRFASLLRRVNLPESLAVRRSPPR